MDGKSEIDKVSGHAATEQDSEAGWRRCVSTSRYGGFAGGGAEKNPAGNYSINTHWKSLSFSESLVGFLMTPGLSKFHGIYDSPIGFRIASFLNVGWPSSRKNRQSARR
jgi:hypothetical protein